MNKDKKLLTNYQLENMEQLTVAEQIITDPAVKVVFYQTVYKSPNNNAWEKGVINFNRISLASERMLNTFTGDRLVTVGRGLGNKSIMSEGMKERAKIIVCMLIDQQINDDLIINEGRVSRDFSGGGISYSEAANKFSSPFDTTFEAVRAEIRKSGLMEYLLALETELEDAGVLFNPDAYLRLEDYSGSKGTAYQKDNSEVEKEISDFELVGLPNNVVGDGTTKDSLNYILNKFNYLIASNVCLNSSIEGVDNVQKGFDYTYESFKDGTISGGFKTGVNGTSIKTKDTEILFYPNSVILYKASI